VNPRLSHEEAVDQLPAAALEILDSSEQIKVMEHVRGCEQCRRLLDDHRQAAGQLAHLIPKQTLDPLQSVRLRRHVMNRVRQSKRGRSTRLAFLAERWSGWMVAAGLAGVLLVHHGFHQPLAYGWIAAGILMLSLVSLGVYARVQHGRLADLQDRLAASEKGSAHRRGS
jgi:hypothetical protein